MGINAKMGKHNVFGLASIAMDRLVHFVSEHGQQGHFSKDYNYNAHEWLLIYCADVLYVRTTQYHDS